MNEYSFDDLELLPIENPALKDINLIKILYSDEFKALISKLNALIKVNEHSPRSLFITQQVIQKVPSNYTAWQFRFNIIKDISDEGDLLDELEWCSETAKSNEKNYQIWHYRELIIDHLIASFYNNDQTNYDLDKEFNIVEEMLDKDEKNYHVWTHKRWLVRYFNLKSDERELQYTYKLIKQDVRNNSAWCHRMFVLSDDNSDDTVFKSELEIVERAISEAPTNPSSWLYLRGLCKKFNKPITAGKFVVDQYRETDDVGGASIPALELYLDILIEEKQLEKAKLLLDMLSTQLDTVRANYWKYKGQGI